jgi:hypothetical protein
LNNLTKYIISKKHNKLILIKYNYMKIYRIIEYKNRKSTFQKYFNNDIEIVELNLYNHDLTEKYLLNVLNVPQEYVTLYKKLINNKESFLILLLLYYSDNSIVINDKVTIEFDKLNDYIDYNLVIVKSVVCKNLFMGFSYSKKNNENIKKTIDIFIDCPHETTNLNDIFYGILTSKEDNNNLILTEKLIDGISEIKFNDITLAKHYYSFSSLDMTNIKSNTIKDLNKIKIGITFNVPKDYVSLYSNGINQNALYFFEVLKNIGYETRLIISGEKEENFKNILEKITFYKYNYSVLENVYLDEFDVLFEFGFSLSKNILSNLKLFGSKIVSYKCGNSYIIDSETVLYSQHDTRKGFGEFLNNKKLSNRYDQMWSIPQMYKQNKHYWEILHRSECIQIPFIWSSNSINFIKSILEIDNEDEIKCTKKNNKIAIFEPNISIMKWCLPCMLICEKSYRKHKNIDHVYVTNVDISSEPKKNKINDFSVQGFTNLCNGLDIFNDNKMTCEKRFITIEFMKKYAYIAVSHQWENPLNYLYFDLAWLGWPVLHNAHLCKDVGYYYNDFNYDEASEKLNEIINNHEMNIDEYIKHNRKIIDKYLPTNKELQNKYKNLIENLFTNK